MTGPAGVGKTALVLRRAHRNATAFPDGRIGVNVGGAPAYYTVAGASGTDLGAFGVEQIGHPGSWVDWPWARRRQRGWSPSRWGQSLTTGRPSWWG
ncbi:hypothetical protein [Kitasatospora sp. NPDC056531]|uniref:hypothetical protein n=1 Tax=Kitasatospora sp. NPDC056531 TaxID=3345856 RepID=UPI00368C19D2